MFGTKCVHLNLRSVIILIICVVLNGIQYSNTAINNDMEHGSKNIVSNKNITNSITNTNPADMSTSQNDGMSCPENVSCDQLPAYCIKCNFNYSCIYGQQLEVRCNLIAPTTCNGGHHSFTRSMICRYCWQTENWEHYCTQKDICNSADQFYFSNCSVRSDLLCLGNRTFTKRIRCNWTKGSKWSTALFISIAFGGFGADRFYLGHWQEGIGKLFSFGGFGVWTIVDVILISLHYLGPADGSLYL